MRRYLGWAFLLAAGLLLGMASSPCQRSNASPPTSIANADSANADVVAELKEIKTKLKEINTHLRTGVTRVFVNMNP